MAGSRAEKLANETLSRGITVDGAGTVRVFMKGEWREMNPAAIFGVASGLVESHDRFLKEYKEEISQALTPESVLIVAMRFQDQAKGSRRRRET